MNTLTILSYIKSNGDKFLITNRTTTAIRGVVAVALLSNLAIAQLKADDLRGPRPNAAQATMNPASEAKAVTTLGLVGYWSFDEASGTVIHDLSANANNGTLTCSGSC